MSSKLDSHRSRLDSDTTLQTTNAPTETNDLKSSSRANSVSPLRTASPDIDKPPNGGYGWAVTVAVFLINFHVWGINATFGVFLAYFLSNSYYPGATSFQFAMVGGLSIGAAYVVAPIVTLSTHYLGTKATLTIGLVLETLGLITAGSSTEIWQLFLSLGVSFGFGIGFLFIGSLGTVPQWFTTKRSLANGICSSGSGIGAVVYTLATQAIIQRWGVPWAFRILGICAFCSNTFSVLIIKDRNKQVGARTKAAFDYKMLQRVEFVGFLGWAIFSIFGYVVLLFTLPSYAASIGLSSDQGSIVSAVLNLGQGFGRPLTGFFSDHTGRINMAAFMTFMCGIFVLAIWIPAKSYAVLIVFALLGGSVVGTFFATLAPVAAEVVGLPSVPPAISLMWLALVVPATFSEAIALEIAQHTPSGYLGTQIFTAMMFIAASACLIPVRGWKINANMREESSKQPHQPDEEVLNNGTRATSQMRTWRAVFVMRRV